MSAGPLDSLDALLIDQALMGLTADGASRLQAALRDQSGRDPEAYERLAAALDGALWQVRSETLPAHLRQRIVADAAARLHGRLEGPI